MSYIKNSCKDITESYISSYEDSFSLNNYCNSPITIICHEAKVCLLSHKTYTVSCNNILFVYGIILVKIIYVYGPDSKRHSQVFVKPFSKEICLPSHLVKLVSISANIINKYYKRLCNDILLGFYSIQFNIKLKVPHTVNCNTINDKNLSEICSSNTLNLNDDCFCNPCNENQQLSMPTSFEERILNDIQNDCFSSITNPTHNTRL